MQELASERLRPPRRPGAPPCEAGGTALEGRAGSGHSATSPSRPHCLPPLSPISPVPAPSASKHNQAGALASSAVPKQRPSLPPSPSLAAAARSAISPADLPGDSVLCSKGHFFSQVLRQAWVMVAHSSHILSRCDMVAMDTVFHQDRHYWDKDPRALPHGRGHCSPSSPAHNMNSPHQDIQGIQHRDVMARVSCPKFFLLLPALCPSLSTLGPSLRQP